MLIEREPVEIRQAGQVIGTGLCDADPPSYIRVYQVDWTGIPDLFLNGELSLAFADGQRKLHTVFRGSLVAGASPPTDLRLTLMQHEGF